MVIIAGPRDRREREIAACNSTAAPVSIYRRPDSGHRREIARCKFTQELRVTMGKRNGRKEKSPSSEWYSGQGLNSGEFDLWPSQPVEKPSPRQLA